MCIKKYGHIVYHYRREELRTTEDDEKKTMNKNGNIKKIQTKQHEARKKTTEKQSVVR